MLIDIISVAFTFGVIIFIHELGHFLLGKAYGVKIEKFAFGFGPEIAGRTIGETRYRLCAVPLGGYVRFAGDEPETATGDPREFFSQKWYRRIAIVVAGPLMNYFLAIIFIFITIYFSGVGIPSNEPVIGLVAPDMPAARAGLKEGDVIVTMDGVEIKFWQDISKIVHKSAGKKMKFFIKRGEKIIKVDITPEFNKELSVGLIGISPKMFVQKVGLIKSFITSINHTVGLSIFYVRYLIERLIKWEKPEVAGPVGIAQFISKAAHAGLSSFLLFVGQISVMIGLLNLFPVPVLDGGHILYYTIEGITGKSLSRKVMEAGNFVGLSLLVALMLFAFYSDFERLGLIRFIRKLF
ncbi:MAG: RIP metalloprotease RseP [Elusimicrobiota bacterium]